MTTCTEVPQSARIIRAAALRLAELSSDPEFIRDVEAQGTEPAEIVKRAAELLAELAGDPEFLRAVRSTR